MIINADARSLPLADESVQCVVTSPPYWGLRDYGTARWEGGDAGCDHSPEKRGGRFATPVSSKQGSNTGSGTISSRDCSCGAIRIDAQIGLEKTPAEYVATMVSVFREVRRVLKKDGVVWLNLGDSYASSTGAGQGRPGGGIVSNRGANRDGCPVPPGLKPKDLVGIPWRVAFALQADGWWLRSDIIWAKPNPMPESVTDRPTRSHEYLFLLTKSARYYYDAAAILERGSDTGSVHVEPENRNWDGRRDGTVTGKGEAHKSGTRTGGNLSRAYAGVNWATVGRNRRSVWTIATQPFSEAHFATFPEKLVEPCVLAGSRPGDTVLDPFAGSGTVGRVCTRFGREFVGVELNEKYIAMASRRNSNVQVTMDALHD